MRTVRNTTHRPLRVPLPRGKVLHLAPGQEGQVSTHDLDHPPLAKMADEGRISISGEKKGVEGEPGQGSESGHVHDDTHGHHPDTSVPMRGNR